MFTEMKKEQIIQHFKNSNFSELFFNFCRVEDNRIIIDYVYFKYLGNSNTYLTFRNLILKCIDDILANYEKFECHISIKKLTILEINKHIDYIRNFSNLLKETYQDKMNKCFIHNASALFSQIYDIIVPFIDKDTQQKIQLL